MSLNLGILISGGFAIYSLYYSLKSNRISRQAASLKVRRAREIETVQKEIFQQSLAELSRDLHDDFVQRLSMVKLRLSAVLPDTQGETHALLADTKEITAQILQDLRNMSHYLDMSSSREIRLPELIQEALDRIKRSGHLSTKLAVEGIPRTLPPKTSLIVFRIFQESLNNVIAHSQATACEVTLYYGKDELFFQIHDNGIGFDHTATGASGSKGIGLKNIKERSALIDAVPTIRSGIGSGTKILIVIPYLSPIRVSK